MQETSDQVANGYNFAGFIILIIIVLVFIYLNKKDKKIAQNLKGTIPPESKKRQKLI